MSEGSVAFVLATAALEILHPEIQMDVRLESVVSWCSPVAERHVLARARSVRERRRPSRGAALSVMPSFWLRFKSRSRVNATSWQTPESDTPPPQTSRRSRETSGRMCMRPMSLILAPKRSRKVRLVNDARCTSAESVTRRESRLSRRSCTIPNRQLAPASDTPDANRLSEVNAVNPRSRATPAEDTAVSLRSRDRSVVACARTDVPVLVM
mmetsp:Transcript_42652/g.100345  ORF Transcript_42652/g.100345 Transcript_42652/m.100345 type:complete len:211 (+) Transcript_42652:100-732(+)